MPWQELVKTALLGTEHSSLSAETLKALQEQGIDVQKEAPLVLAEAAALYVQLKKAGFPLEDFKGELPRVAQRENEKFCSHRSAHHLHLILSGKYPEVLPEFIEHLLKNKKCLPTEHLPALLNRSDIQNWWPSLEAAVGTSGRWLLAQHPDWKKLLDDPSNFDWRTGSRQERLTLLLHLRKHKPEQALVLLQSTWNEESYQDKASFLETLETSLSMDDEPFLELCLSEGRKEVRQVAGRLLAKLPGSHLSERMWQRASGFFEWNGKTLKVTISTGPGEDALKDGILKIHADWKGGARAGFLGQVVSLIPPKDWEDFFGKNPEKILRLFTETDWVETLLNAVAQAAVFHRNQTWLDALTDYWFGHEDSPLWHLPVTARLLESASTDALNRLALQWFERNRDLPEANAPVFKLLKANPHPWQDRLTLLVLERFQQWLEQGKSYGWQSFHHKELLKLASLHCNPALLERLQKGWNNSAPQWHFWEKPVEEMLNSVLFRKEMISRLASDD